MSFWDIDSPQRVDHRFGKISPIQILAEFDDPQTFTFVDLDNRLMLAHLTAMGPNRVRYFVATTTPNTVRGMLAGYIPIRDALDKSLGWLLDVTYSGDVIACWQQSIPELPDDALPADDVVLSLELMPLAVQAAGRFHLEGGPVSKGRVYASFLGKFCDSWQNLQNAVAQVFQSEPTDRAPIAQKIIAQNRLLISAFGTGSFVINFELDPPQDLLEPNWKTLDRVASMVVGGISDESTMELVTHSRVKLHYERILKLLNSQGVSLGVRTKNVEGVLAPAAALEKLEALSLFDADFQTLEISGELIMGHVETNRFEIREDENTVYRGSVSPDTVGELKQFRLGTRVTASLEVLTEKPEMGGPESISYVLTGVTAEKV